MDWAERHILSKIEESVQRFAAMVNSYTENSNEVQYPNEDDSVSYDYYNTDNEHNQNDEQRLKHLLNDLHNIFSVVEDLLPDEIFHTVRKQERMLDRLQIENDKLVLDKIGLQHTIDNRRKGGRPLKDRPQYIKELKENGYSVTEIAKKTNLSRQTIYEYLKKK